MSNSYDQRLFSGGIRRLIHEARFNWLRQKTLGLSGSVVELGCFNGRAIGYLGFTPDDYLGLDAGWENGLDEAKSKYPSFRFKQSTDPNDIIDFWDLAIALETLEHLPRPGTLEIYIEKLARHSKVLIATFPNEIGFLFASKFLIKKIFFGGAENYKFSEFIYQSFGFCNLVEQNEHKGFDYRLLIDLLQRHFIIECCEGIPIPFTKMLSTQIGIVAKSKYF
jgi:hypothetical protein